MFADAARIAARLAAQLGWTPDIFWQATPADLCDALGLGLPVTDAVDTAVLRSLMEAFPDG